MRVVVVGAMGHIGTYLVPRLVRDGNEVVAMSRGRRQPYHPDPAWDSVEKVTVDRDSEDAQGIFGQRVASLHPDAVIDLVCFTPSSARELATALAGSGTYLLHCGTIWVHGTGVEVPLREDAPRRPFGEYGTSKAAIEEFLLGPARTTGLRYATVLHPGHIVGPGWAPVNPAGNFNLEIFSRLARGEELALPNLGLETVHHVHADDVAQAFEAALNNPQAADGEAFHVVSERAVTLRGYAESVAAWFGQPSKLSFQPWDRWAEGEDPSDAAATWEHVSRSPSVSIAKAERVIGYHPGYTSLEGVFESVAWLTAQGQIDAAGRTPTM